MNELEAAEKEIDGLYRELARKDRKIGELEGVIAKKDSFIDSLHNRLASIREPHLSIRSYPNVREAQEMVATKNLSA